MPAKPVKITPPAAGADGLTRRSLLKAAVAAGVAAPLLAQEAPPPPPVGPAASEPARPPESAPSSNVAPPELPWWLSRDRRHARVVDIRSKIVVRTNTVDRSELGGMIDRGLQALTDERTPEQAWRSVLGNAKHIVLKFNSVGAAVLNTNDTFARVLVKRLDEAGYDPETIALVEAPAVLTQELGTRNVDSGWGESIPVGKDYEQLAGYLLEADAVINVPLLKTHMIAGMSGAMKNLAYAVIRRPARYHDNACAPYVGQVIGARPVASRLKLTLANALRVVVDRGPEAEERDVADHGGLLIGFDPLAVDTVGWGVLTQARRKAGLRDLGEIPHLTAAAQSLVGRSRSADIERMAIDT